MLDSPAAAAKARSNAKLVPHRSRPAGQRHSKFVAGRERASSSDTGKNSCSFCADATCNRIASVAYNIKNILSSETAETKWNVFMGVDAAWPCSHYCTVCRSKSTVSQRSMRSTVLGICVH